MNHFLGRFVITLGREGVGWGEERGGEGKAGGCNSSAPIRVNN